MNKFAEKNKTSLGVVSAITFVISYGLCALFGWLDVVNNLFSTDGLGQPLKMPVTYTLISFLFFAIIIALVIFGFVFKNKAMLLISFFYNLLFVLSFVLLMAFATGNVTDDSLYSLLTYLLTFTLLPVYGVIWNIRFLFIVIFIPLLIFNIIAVVRAFKRSKKSN